MSHFSPLLVGITIYKVISDTMDQLAFRRSPENSFMFMYKMEMLANSKYPFIIIYL